MLFASNNKMLMGIYASSSTGSSSIEVTSWVSTITAAGFTTPSSTVIAAAQTLIDSLYAYGLRTDYKNSYGTNKVLRLNLFSGGDYKGSFIPLIADIGQIADYNGKYGGTTIRNLSAIAQGPFQSSDWNLSGSSAGFNAASNANYNVGGTVSGSTSTNTIKVLDTTVPNNNALLSADSVHIACYNQALNISSSVITNLTDMGVADGSVNFNLQCGATGNSTQTVRFNCYTQDVSSTAGGTLSAAIVPTGFFTGSRLASNYSSIYLNGYTSNLVYRSGSPNPVQSVRASVTFTSATFMLFCRGSGGTYGTNKTITNATDRTVSMYSIGKGLSDSDVANLYQIINNFNTAVGRPTF